MRFNWWFIFLLLQSAAAQDTLLKPVQSYALFKPADKDHAMTDLKKMIPDLVLDLRYATKNNFTGTTLYPPLSTTYCRRKTALALKAVQEELRQTGYGLKIFDAYRPYSVTVKMWELIKDERYVASPYKGSGHNRGIAIDCTIVDLATSKEIDMGTSFDNFSDTAHIGFLQLPDTVLKNRNWFFGIMKRHGLVPLETEWWHFSVKDASDYEILDLSFEELQLHCH